ncbi:MAG: ferrous iron transport protein B [Lentisphaeria bacterium]
MKKNFTVALAGNPNCGKTCIFNALTGARQHVGNYPGVTVESKSGSFFLDDIEIRLIDLPGVYSLSSSSPEEDVVFQELTKTDIDLIINVVDSTIPERNLYLTTQLAELHIPLLLAFNMADEANKKGLKFDIPKLEKYFGSTIVQTIGYKKNGVKPLLEALSTALKNLENHGVPMLSYSHDIDDSIAVITQKIDTLRIEKYRHIPARFFAIKLLEHDTAAMRIPEFKPVWNDVETQIRHLMKKHAIQADTFMADRRYAMLSGACHDTISMTRAKRHEISDKIDNIMTNKYLGLPLFFVIIYFTFYFTFTCAAPFMTYIEMLFNGLNQLIKAIWAPEVFPYLRSLLTDGIIGGVGGVLVFLPNILFLFFAIAILEDSGYMSRAAFVMDGIMRKFGLQGRSFVPLILGFGCTVPAIMATRTIESERDRKVTIMVLPLMSCGARLTIYALIIPAFFVLKYQAFMMWIIYLIGVAIALIAALIMKKTLFKGEGEVYLMELPPYRVPTFKSLLFHMWDRGKAYLQKAGTIILVASIILFICNTLPQKKVFSENYDAQIAQFQKSKALQSFQIDALAKNNTIPEGALSEIRKNNTISAAVLKTLKDAELTLDEQAIVNHTLAANAEITKLRNRKKAESMEYTISGKIGHALEPIFRHIGFDWKVTTASLGALAAKEVFVSQLGILYAQGDVDQNSSSLREQLRKHYTQLQGFCIMLFSLLSIPCLATLAIIKREMNSWKWSFIEGAWLLLLAYILTFIVYQCGTFLHIGTTMLS